VEQELGYYNGEVKPLKNLKIPATDRAVYFGDGVYDVAYAIDLKAFALQEHIDRFYNSCRLLSIDFDMPKEELKKIMENLIKQQKNVTQRIYWQVSRGSGIREHTFIENSKPNLLITIDNNNIVDMKKIRYNLALEEDKRFLYCNIKTLNLIPSVLYSEKAKKQNCNEVVLYRGEYITECAHSNIAILKNGIFQTAPLNNLILPGVTRGHIIKFCNRLNIPVLETPFTITQLLDADEIIVCASGCLCMGVSNIDGKKVGGKAPKLLDAIQNEYIKEFINQCGRYI